ncbi:MAG: hypothetical protein GVY12_06465 [Bacteroidetes bacterium]|jgi:signal transduction histidine kinase|nr:hypothetical protein [Bacteroidota bacterium]
MPFVQSSLQCLRAALRNEGISQVGAFRIVFVLAAPLVVGMGWVYQWTDPGAYDPMWIRWTVMAVTLGLLALTFHPRCKDYIVPAVHTYVFLLLTWFVWLAAVNQFSANYSIGLFYVLVACLLVLSLGRTFGATHVAFLLYTGGATSLMLFLLPEVQVSRLVLWVCVLSALMLTCVTWLLQRQLAATLRRSQDNLAEAQRLVGLGNWEWDPQTGRGHGSDEAYRLLGCTPGDEVLSPEKVAAALHPDDRTAFRASVQAARNDKAPPPIRVRTLGVNGRAGQVLQVRVRCAERGGYRRLVGTLLNVTAQVQREEALRAAKEEAEQMARLKDAFLANMSHEIRTPLTAIIGFAQVLEDELEGEEQELLQSIGQGGRRLLQTLNSVLDFARLEAGELQVERTEVAVQEEIRHVVRELREQARAKGLPLQVNAPEEPLLVLADPGALGRVLTNLISNAIKFTAEGFVSVVAETAGPDVLIRVKDTGIGISEAFLPHLFEEFEQESSGLNRNHEGSGIGLTITKRLVDLMQGHITVESKKGNGTTFTVQLPAAAAGASSGAAGRRAAA